MKNVIDAGQKSLFISINLHGLYLQFKNKQLNAIQNNAIVRVDGMPIVWLARIFGNKTITKDDRVTWMDWKDHFFDFCNSNSYKLFYVGSKPGLESKIEKFIKYNYPNIVFKNANGYFKFDSNEENNLIDELNAFKPNILLVGMGMPRQEVWCSENLPRLETNTLITCGAAMEYIIGEVKVPPRWMGKVGLEWLYRFMESPQRFFFRYFIEPWLLLLYIVKNRNKK
ncbi:MAG: WecB/TagA/CpsF family glycosyltransferase [Reichenbachiella sp.]